MEELESGWKLVDHDLNGRGSEAIGFESNFDRSGFDLLHLKKTEF
jgi:hypothetical protein